MSDRINKMADALMAGVQGYIGRCLAPIGERLKALDARLDALPTPERGEKGEPGEVGTPGKDGRDGADGKDGASGVNGRDGIDGKDGATGVDGQKGADGISGKDGADGAPGRDGIDGKDGAPGMPGQKGADGIDGRDGMEGQPGRDAIHVDVLDGIDPAKKYGRGTFAAYRGGIVRSFRSTDPLPSDGELERSGWHVVVRGLSDISVAVAEDMRTVTVTHAMTDGATVVKSVSLPTMIYRGIWRDEESYTKGDTATRGGSLWVLTGEPTGKPGEEASGWQLAVKKGTDGRDGLKGEKGERGGDGRSGRDATQLGPNGGKW